MKKRIVRACGISDRLLEWKGVHRLRGITALLGAIFLGVGLILSGCSEDSFDLNVKVADATGTITGKVIDGATRAPIGDADLTLIVNGQKRTAKSSVDADPDLTGTFVFGGVPAGDHTLKVSAAGFAVIQFSVEVASSRDNTPVTENVGLVPLGKAFDLTVVATADGTAVSGVTVFAEPEGTSFDCSKSSFFFFEPIFASSDSEHEISAVTGADGKATLTGLNQCVNYMIVAAPHDGNGDGQYDHVTAAAFFDGATNSARTVSLALAPAQRNDEITVVATSTDPNQSAGFGIRNITDTGADPGTNSFFGFFGSFDSTVSTAPIKIVFNYPVSLSGGMTVSTNSLLVNPDASPAVPDDVTDATFGDTVILTAPAALDSTGTILTINPPTGGFPKNEMITLNGSVTATIFGATSIFSDGILDGNLYVADDTATGLSATTTLTADNYNGSTGTTVGSGTVYLEFPEYVTGTFRVISTTVGTTVTEINGPTNTIDPFSGEMVFTDGSLVPACGSCGTGAGIFYRVPTGEFLANGDKIKVAVDVTDAEGNHFNKEVELTVQ